MTIKADELWGRATRARERFSTDRAASLPHAAQRYLRHALAPGVALSEDVRLKMRGSIRLGGRWYPFEGTQVTVWSAGFRWDARVSMRGLPVRGYDCLVDGVGEMRWHLFGVIPFVQARGADVTRSALGRMMAEVVLLPAVLLRPDVSFRERGRDGVTARLALGGEHTELELEVAESGALRSLCSSRWGNPEGGAFGAFPFGGYVEAERTFAGITIPTELRIGWFMGSERFAPEGEFFRATILEAEFS